ncbi:MAG: squalene/phytoene synthase family protein [Archangium sp.]|nr:squalene/phytoene synthase family protein [Archangium sp.]
MDLDDLLTKTSRTFALAIPLLPEPTRRAVGVAYLLFRVADTFEDSTTWPREARIDALEAFVELLELSPQERNGEAKRLSAAWLERPPVEHEGYLELLRDLPALLAQLDELAPAVKQLVVKHTVRTTEGMASVVARADERGNLRLGSVRELKDYCYIVAGIVGELLTEVFLHDSPSLGTQTRELEQRMRSFGEGLQLVNILKDAGDDAVDGRVYLPPSVPRAELFALARADLEDANRYVQALQRGGAPRGFLAFTGLSLVLAFAALDRIEADGAGAKVSRQDVMQLFETLERKLDGGGVLDLR